MKNLVVISINEYETLKSLVDDLQCFLESIQPKYQPEICTFLDSNEPYPTEEELSQLF